MSRKENHQESEIQKERAQKIKDLLDDIWLPKNWDRDYVLEKLHGQSRLSDDYLWFDQLPKIDRQYLFWEDLLKKDANNVIAAIQSFELYGIGKDDPITTTAGEKITFGELSGKIVEVYKNEIRLSEIRTSLEGLVIRVESANPGIKAGIRLRLMEKAKWLVG